MGAKKPTPSANQIASTFLPFLRGSEDAPAYWHMGILWIVLNR